VKALKWRIRRNRLGFWVVADPACEMLTAGDRCTCGAYVIWEQAVDHMLLVSRQRAVAAIQDGAQ